LKNKIALLANLNLALYAGLLPWGNALANIQMGLMILFFLCMLLFRPNMLQFNKRKFLIWLAFGGYFFSCVLSILYTEDYNRGVDSLLRKLPLIIFPTYVIFIKTIDKIWITKALKIFSFSVLTVCIVSIIIATINCFETFGLLNWKCITGSNLSEVFISNHKLHFALYIVFAILFLVNELILSNVSFRVRWKTYSSILFLFLFLLLLGTRTTIAVVLLLLFLAGTYILFQRKEYLKYTLLLIGTITLFALSIVYNPILKERIKEAVNYNNEYHISKQWGGTAVRKLIWKYSFEVVNNNPIFGVGLGDAQTELNKSYLNCTESSALKNKNYNAHNEILQIFINTGIIGFIIFYGSQIYLVRKQKFSNRLLMIFLFLFFLSGLTESYLERDMGIRVYSFFSVMLFSLISPNENTSGS
jgi:O-antigen ligase